MFDKFKQLAELNKMRAQAVKIQKELAAEEVEVEEKGVKVVMGGDQKVKSLQIDGVDYGRAVDVLNKAVKKSQKMAAKKLQQMGGGLTGLLKGMGS